MSSSTPIPRHASGANLAAANGLLSQIPGSYEVGRTPAIDDFGADRDDPAVWLRQQRSDIGGGIYERGRHFAGVAEGGVEMPISIKARYAEPSGSELAGTASGNDLSGRLNRKRVRALGDGRVGAEIEDRAVECAVHRLPCCRKRTS